jgi:Tol biopolymer transport system component
MRRILTVLVAATALAISWIGPARAATNGRIVFLQVGRAGIGRIASVHADGTDVKTVVWDGYWTNSRLSVSPSGDEVLVAQYHEDLDGSAASRLVTIDRVSGAVQRVVQRRADTFYSSVAWFPDGTEVAFTRYARRASFRAWACNLDGSDLHRLPTGSHGAFDVAVSVDARRVAFTDHREELFVMRIDGSHLRRVTRAGRAFDPDFSPTSDRLVFSWERRVGGNADLYLVDRDGSNRSPLTDTRRVWEGEPRWSPDGMRLVYTSHTGSFANPVRIFVMRADGTDAHRVLASDAQQLHPDWAAR